MDAGLWAMQMSGLCAAQDDPVEPNPGTCPHTVLIYLRSSCASVSQSDIRQALGIGHPAAAWALLRLRHLGLIECSRDDPRNGRYLRYRAV